MGQFEMKTSVPIVEKNPSGNVNGFQLLTKSDSSSQIQFEPGDVFGFFMPITEGQGSSPSYRQGYSTNFSTGPSHTLYYMNVDGVYPSCVMSLCDPAVQTLSGVQLQIKVSLGEEKIAIIK